MDHLSENEKARQAYLNSKYEKCVECNEWIIPDNGEIICDDCLDKKLEEM